MRLLSFSIAHTCNELISRCQYIHSFPTLFIKVPRLGIMRHNLRVSSSLENAKMAWSRQGHLISLSLGINSE